MANKPLSPGRDAARAAALEEHIEEQRTKIYDAHALIRVSEAALRSGEADSDVVARTIRIAATILETALVQFDSVTVSRIENEAIEACSYAD